MVSRIIKTTVLSLSLLKCPIVRVNRSGPANGTGRKRELFGERDSSLRLSSVRSEKGCRSTLRNFGKDSNSFRRDENVGNWRERGAKGE